MAFEVGGKQLLEHKFPVVADPFLFEISSCNLQMYAQTAHRSKTNCLSVLAFQILRREGL